MADPDLGEGLPPEEFVEAGRCSAGVLRLTRRGINASPGGSGGIEATGALVLRGLLARRLMIEDRHAVELLGPGDLLRRSTLSPETSVGVKTRWRVLEPGGLALLDRRFWEEALQFPALVSALLERSVRRSDSLLARLAIAECPQAASRVHLVLWHLADRWGRVARGGVLLPLPLSRTTIADLVCARRETVSRAMTVLAATDLVRPHERGFFLTGRSPTGRT